MRKKLFKFIPICLMFSFVNFGCAATQSQNKPQIQPTQKTEQQEENVYTGEIVGKSDKAKTISIEVGKGDQAKTIMFKFDDSTKGLDQAVKGHAATVKYAFRENTKYATEIKLKLAKLPEGITEIKTEELQDLIKNDSDMFLVDSRPAIRHGQSHLPGAVSIPVPLLQEKQADMLPEDKNRLIIFYCGGPT